MYLRSINVRTDRTVFSNIYFHIKTYRNLDNLDYLDYRQACQLAGESP